MIYTHLPQTDGNDRCQKCGWWSAVHVEPWRHWLWRLTRIRV